MKRSKGVTLMEVLVVVSVAVMVGSILLAILVNQTGIFNRQNALIRQGLSLNDSLRIISEDIRQASNIVAGYPESIPQYLTSNSTLVLKLNSIDTSGTSTSNFYDYIVITADSNPKILKRKVFPSANSSRRAIDQVLTSILQGVSFIYLDKNGLVTTPTNAADVTTTLSVLAPSDGTSASQSASTTAALRNTP